MARETAWHAAGCGCHIGRRDLLAGVLGATGAGLGARRLRADEVQAPMPAPIDVHHHFVPPPYLQVLSDPMPPIRGWTPARDIEDLDRAGTRTAILSVTTPGLWFGNLEQSRKLARICNDYGARMAADRPGRYRLFGALPLPDVDGSLAELTYALDTLKADGIGLFTSYDGAYLGDVKFAPLFEELNRRRAIVYVHPSEPQCCVNLLPAIEPPMPTAIIEYGTDTTRTIASYLFTGAANRFPDVKMIFSHAGGLAVVQDPARRRRRASIYRFRFSERMRAIARASSRATGFAKRCMASRPRHACRRRPTSPRGPSKVYAELLDHGRRVLAGGGSVVLDAVFDQNADRAQVAALARSFGLRLDGLWLQATLETRKARVADGQGDPSDASLNVVERQEQRDLGPMTWTTINVQGNPDRSLQAVRSLLDTAEAACAEAPSNRRIASI